MRIWFNHHFPAVYRVINLLRAGDAAREFTLLCSHRDPLFIGFAAADEHACEPDALSRDGYVDWALEFARARGVDVLVPGSKADPLVAATPRFAAQGVRVLGAAPPDVLPNLHDKAWLYRDLAGLVPLAAGREIHSPDELEGALEEVWAAGLEACIKPVQGIYGRGFHPLMRPGPQVRLQRGLRPSEWRGRYARDGSCGRHLVLEYLPGHEYSVDGVAVEGRLLAAVARKKSLTSNTQKLVAHPDLQRHAELMAQRYRLNGMFNIQFKEDLQGEARLLEINPRASGGIAMSCLSGINLPYLALRTFLGGADAMPVPAPRLNLRVAETAMPVVLPDA